MKQVGNVKAGQGAHHVEGADLASYRGVLGQLSFIVSFDVDALVHTWIQRELTQVKLDLDVCLHQTPCQSHSIQKQVGAVEMKLHLDFHARHQDASGVKGFQVRLKHQTATRSSHIRSCFGFGQSQGGFVVD